MLKKISAKAEEVEKKSEGVMSKFLNDSATTGERFNYRRPVISIDKNSIFVDLKPWGTGVIFGREYINARDIIKNKYR